MLKLRKGRGSRGIYVIGKDTEGHYFYKNTREIHTSPRDFFDILLPQLTFSDQYIVMEKLNGPVCDLDVLA